MNDNKELVIGITDYDNRWNKMAVEIAKEHLNPNSPAKPKDKTDNGRVRCCEPASKESK